MTVRFATCSFSEFKPEMGLPVRATVGHPRFLSYELAGTLEAAAPMPWMLRTDLSYDEFQRHMIKKLDSVGIEKFVASAQTIANNHGQPDATIVLGCWENAKNGKGFCHRRMVAAWLEANGYDCPEVGTLSLDDPACPDRLVSLFDEEDEEPVEASETAGVDRVDAGPVVTTRIGAKGSRWWIHEYAGRTYRSVVLPDELTTGRRHVPTLCGLIVDEAGEMVGRSFGSVLGDKPIVWAHEHPGLPTVEIQSWLNIGAGDEMVPLPEYTDAERAFIAAGPPDEQLDLGDAEHQEEKPVPAVYVQIVSKRSKATRARVLWRMTEADAKRVCSDDRTSGRAHMLVWTAKPGVEGEDWEWTRDSGRYDELLTEFGIIPERKPVTGSKLTAAERRAAHRMAAAGPQPSTPPATDRPDCDETIRTVVAVAATALRGSSLEGRCTCGDTHWAKAVDGPYPRRRKTDLDRVLSGWGYELAGPWKGQRAPVARIEATPAVPEPEPVNVLEEPADVAPPAPEPDPVPAPEEEPAPVVTAPRTRVREIPLDQIQRDERQPREEFEETALQELADSIAVSGLLQPIVVRELGRKRFEIVMGERRWRASQRVPGMETITAIVREYGDEQDEARYVAQIAENVGRKDMTLLEEAKAYARLRDQYERTPEEIAKLFGKTPAHVKWRMDLLTLCPEAVDALNKGLIGTDFAWYVARLSPANQVVALGRYVRGEFADEQQARTFAKGLQVAERQGPGFFEMAEEPEEVKVEKRAAKAKAHAQVDAVEAAVAALSVLNLKSPEELAELFAGSVGKELDRMDTVFRQVQALRKSLRTAKGLSEARTYAVRADVTA